MALRNVVDISPTLAVDGESEEVNQRMIDGFIAGDSAATNSFHYRYSTRISRWVWRLLGTDRDHEDMVQQVFVNILRGIPKLKKADSLDAWVDSVTIRTVRYELRKRKVRRSVFFCKDGMEPDNIRDKKSPFKQNHIRTFYNILNSMPADDRIVFVLRFLEGCRIDEIAAIGGYSGTTAKRRLIRAKRIFAEKALRDSSLISLVEEGYAF